MKIEVNVSKGYFFVILGAVLLLVGVVGVVAYFTGPGAVPNPGHALTSIQGYFSGDTNLQTSLGKFCQKDGTYCPTIRVKNCHIVSGPALLPEEGASVAYCNADEFLSGQSCTSSTAGEVKIFGIYAPNDLNGKGPGVWCSSKYSRVFATALCCQIGI